jgi:hypothetical protein
VISVTSLKILPLAFQKGNYGTEAKRGEPLSVRPSERILLLSRLSLGHHVALEHIHLDTATI